jgi:hypothetical protein
MIAALKGGTQGRHFRETEAPLLPASAEIFDDVRDGEIKSRFLRLASPSLRSRAGMMVKVNKDGVVFGAGYSRTFKTI